MKAKTLGQLEQTVMEIVWKSKEASVRNVLKEVLIKRPVAYTTIATIMQRLFGKGLVIRKAVKKNYVYSPKVSKESYVKSLTKSFVNKLEKSFGDVAISSFAQSIEALPDEKKRYLLKILERYEFNR